MKTDPTCLFCKIISGQIPAAKVYEDENTLAFLDIHPNSKGHTLLVPKDHISNLASPDATKEILGTLMERVQKVMHAQVTGLRAERSIILIEGELVPHLHVHVIPKYRDIKLKIGDHISYENDTEIENTKNLLAETLK